MAAAAGGSGDVGGGGSGSGMSVAGEAAAATSAVVPCERTQIMVCARITASFQIPYFHIRGILYR